MTNTTPAQNKNVAGGPQTYRRHIVEAKRGAIVKAARTHFLKSGYAGAGMSDIARDADVSTATLYKHFGSKEDLFAAIVKEEARFLRQEFAAPPPGATLADMFHASARLTLASYMKSDLHVMMRIVIAEVPFAPEIARSMFDTIVERWHRGVSRILDRMIEGGVLKPHDTRLSSIFLAGMVKETFIWPALFNADYAIPQDDDPQIREMVALFLTRYGAKKSDVEDIAPRRG